MGNASPMIFKDGKFVPHSSEYRLPKMTMRGKWHPVRQCSWCRKVKIPGQWIDHEPNHANVTHGICPSCLRVFTAQNGLQYTEAN